MDKVQPWESAVAGVGVFSNDRTHLVLQPVGITSAVNPGVMTQCSTTLSSSRLPMKTMLLFPELHEWTLAEGAGPVGRSVSDDPATVYLILCTQHHHPAL